MQTGCLPAKKSRSPPRPTPQFLPEPVCVNQQKCETTPKPSTWRDSRLRDRIGLTSNPRGEPCTSNSSSGLCGARILHARLGGEAVGRSAA